MSFNWQTEEEREDLWQEEESPAPSPPGWRRLIPLFVVVVALVGGGWLLWQRAQERVLEAEAGLQDEVWSSHELGQLALEAGDGELFLSLLSGRDDQWTAAQQALFEQGLVYDRLPKLLGLFPAGGDPELVDVSFNPDLQEATLTTTQSYTTTLLEEVDQTFALEQSRVYRRGSSRWLLSPPETTFWGQMATTSGSYLAVRYPVRDEVLVERLARDLDIMLATLCQTDLNCPPNFEARLHLSTEPTSALRAAKPETRFTSGFEVELPTPTLVGLPVDETGYQALLQGYSRYLLTSVLSTSYECCEGILFHQALLRYRLGQRDLSPPPLSSADYLYLLDLPLSFDYLADLWWENEPVALGDQPSLAILSLVEFLAEESSLSLGTGDDLVAWLNEVSDEEWRFGEQERLEEAWLNFVRRKVRISAGQLQTPPGLPALAQDLLLACDNTVYRYDFATDNWSQAIEAGTEVIVFSVLPDGSGFIMVSPMQQISQDGSNFITYLDYGGALGAVANSAEDQLFFMPLYWIDDRQAVVWLYRLEEQGRYTTELALVELSSCINGECRYEPLPGFPLYSPDGQQVVAQSGPTESRIALYYRPDESEEWKEVAEGMSPFWLDASSFGYISDPGSSINRSQAVMVYNTSGAARPLFDAEMVQAALPPVYQEDGFEMLWVKRHPFKPDTLLLTGVAQRADATRFPEGETLLLELVVPDMDREGNSVSLEARLLDTIALRPVSQDVLGKAATLRDKWVEFSLANQDGWGLWLYDLEQERQAFYSLPPRQDDGYFANSNAWDRGNEWLARSLDGMVDLVAPGHPVDGRPYRRLVLHDYDQCTSVGWINRE